MPEDKPTPKQLEDLAREIRQDQKSAKPAEKRVKINTTFKKAVKRIAQTPPPKKEAK